MIFQMNGIRVVRPLGCFLLAGRGDVRRTGCRKASSRADAMTNWGRGGIIGGNDRDKEGVHRKCEDSQAQAQSVHKSCVSRTLR